MADFIDIEISTDPDELKQIITDAMQTAFPTWESNAASWEDVFSEAIALVAADTRDISAQVPKAIFREFGTKLVNLPPIEAASATVTATVTALDTLGHTITAGTEWSLTGADGEPYGFSVLSDVVIAPGSATTGVGAVTLVAVDEGTDYNGLTDPVEQIDTNAWINTIDIVGSTAGGIDAEDDDDYLDRLARELQLLTPRPILPRDFEILYRRLTGVYRALALDLYDPADGLYNHPRTVTLVAVDEAGADVSAGIKAAAVTYFTDQREVNFVVKTMAPTYTTVKVGFTATCYEQYVAADVEAAAEAAVAAYLSPATWGDTPFGEEAEWDERLTVRLFEVASVIDKVDGIDQVLTVTLATGANPLTAADVTLAGPAGLPLAGAITGTVTAP